MTSRDGSSSRLPCAAEAGLPLHSLSNLEAFPHDPVIEDFLPDMCIPDPLNPDPESPSAFVHSVQTFDGDPRVTPDFTSVTVPPMEIVIPSDIPPNPVPAPIHALHRLREELCTLQISEPALH